MHARHITLSNPKRGRLLNVKIKLKQENQTSIHKRDNLGHRPHQKVQGGYSYKHPGRLDGNRTHALWHIGWGLTTRPDGVGHIKYCFVYISL